MADETPGSIVTIEELTGKKRKLELRGPALPRRGTSWDGEQILVTTWYPGNPYRATQQVMGAVELPADWEGIWTTTRMYSCPSFFFDGAGAAAQKIVVASTLRDRVEEFARGGALLRVTWATGDGRSIVREGRIGPFKFPHDRMDDIGWRLTFVWIGRGDVQSRVLSTRNEDLASALRDLAGTLNELGGSISSAAIAAANADLPFSADDFGLGDLEALAATPKTMLASLLRITTGFSNRISRISDLIKNIANTPAELRGQLLDAVSEIVTAVQRLQTTLMRVPAERMTQRPEKPSAVARAFLHVGTVTQKADRTTRSCGSIRTVVGRYQNTSSSRTERHDRATAAHVIATHRATKGDTFAKLGIEFYGDPEKGAYIALANNLPGYQVAPDVGAALVIPVLKSTSAGGYSLSG